MTASDDALGMTVKSGTIATLAFTACLCTGAVYFFSADTAFSVAVGGVIGVVNFLILGMFVRKLFAEERSVLALTLLAMTKLSTLLGGVWLLVVSGVAELMPLVIGYTALPVGIIASQRGPHPAPKKG